MTGMTGLQLALLSVLAIGSTLEMQPWCGSAMAAPRSGPASLGQAPLLCAIGGDLWIENILARFPEPKRQALALEAGSALRALGYAPKDLGPIVSGCAWGKDGEHWAIGIALRPGASPVPLFTTEQGKVFRKGDWLYLGATKADAERFAASPPPALGSASHLARLFMEIPSVEKQMRQAAKTQLLEQLKPFGATLADARDVWFLRQMLNDHYLAELAMAEMKSIELSLDLERDALVFGARVLPVPGGSGERFVRMNEHRDVRGLRQLAGDPSLLLFSNLAPGSLATLEKHHHERLLTTAPWSQPEISYLQGEIQAVEKLGTGLLSFGAYGSQRESRVVLMSHSDQPAALLDRVLGLLQIRWRRSLDRQRESQRHQGQPISPLIPSPVREVPAWALLGEAPPSCQCALADGASVLRLAPMAGPGSSWEFTVHQRRGEGVEVQPLGRLVLQPWADRLVGVGVPGSEPATTAVPGPPADPQQWARLGRLLQLERGPFIGAMVDPARLLAFSDRKLKLLAPIMVAITEPGLVAEDAAGIGAGAGDERDEKAIPELPAKLRDQLAPISLIGWTDAGAVKFQLEVPMSIVNLAINMFAGDK